VKLKPIIIAVALLAATSARADFDRKDEMFVLSAGAETCGKFVNTNLLMKASYLSRRLAS
jgi:hypothetical protein